MRSCGPSCPASLSVLQRNLTELVVAVTDENIVGLFAALLAERRVLLTSSKLSTVRRGSPGQGGTEASLGLSGRDNRGGFLALTPLGETRGQSPGSAPLKVMVALNPGSTFLGEIRGECCIVWLWCAESRLHPLRAGTRLVPPPKG